MPGSAAVSTRARLQSRGAPHLHRQELDRASLPAVTSLAETTGRRGPTLDEIVMAPHHFSEIWRTNRRGTEACPYTPNCWVGAGVPKAPLVERGAGGNFVAALLFHAVSTLSRLLTLQLLNPAMPL